jgi:hypothetical protein
MSPLGKAHQLSASCNLMILWRSIAALQQC